MSGEIAIGIDWMCMLLLLSVSGSSRIDQQLGKNVAMNLVGELFNKIPYTMFPYDAIHIKEFNPHMSGQEILQLRPAPARSGCILRPKNRCVLDDSVAPLERILVPACPLVPHLLMEDIGVASPLYDLCSVLGIPCIYNLPIHLIPWPMPYPIGVPWPVIRYGSTEKERDRGYIVVSSGGKAKLHMFSGGTLVYNLNNVCEAATIHKMGPRPLFCTPCRAVRMSETSIGVILPLPVVVSMGTVTERDEVDEATTATNTTQHHPLCKLYDSVSDSFLCFDPDIMGTRMVEHQWVEENVLPMCSDILIKSWSKCMDGLYKHIGYKKTGVRSMTEEQLRSSLEKDKVYIMGKIVPPRESDSFEQMVWVSIEVYHTVGNLKNRSKADLITIKVPPEDLKPMVDTSGFDVVENHGSSSKKFSIKKSKKRKGSANGGVEEDVIEHQITINRFIFASKTSN